MSNLSLTEQPQILNLPEVTIAKLYAKVPTREIMNEMGKLQREVGDVLTQQKVRPVGAWFTHHFHRPAEFFDFEVCFPIEGVITSQGRVEPGKWPAMRAVRTIYTGQYSGLIDAWGEFMKYIDHEGLRVSEEIYERYLVNPNNEADPSKWQTELIRPLL